MRAWFPSLGQFALLAGNAMALFATLFYAGRTLLLMYIVGRKPKKHQMAELVLMYDWDEGSMSRDWIRASGLTVEEFHRGMSRLTKRAGR